MQAATAAKYLWALPASALGSALACLPLAFGARAVLHSGVLEVSCRARGRLAAVLLRRLPFAAITFGHVVIARSVEDQDSLRTHERVHVAQYERWGLLFLVAYPLESLLQALLGRRPYLDNRFEVAARQG